MADPRGAALALCMLVLATGCGRDAPGTEDASDDDGVALGALPTPAGASGSVTGMPTTGPARTEEVPVEPAPEPMDTPLAEAAPPPDPDAIPIDPATGLAAAPPPNAEPPPAVDTAAAGTLVREYVAALGAGAYAAAQQLWSATPNDSAVLQLARGGAFAADVLPPLRTNDPNAALVGVPVRVRGTGDDGTERSIAVLYTVRRGAEGEWRIASANLREDAP